MTDFKELIVARDELWETLTTTIVAAIPETIQGVVKYLTSNNELAQCDLEISAIAVIEDVVELTGTLVYPVGSTFTPPAGGDQIVVTENTSDYFRRALCMYLPLELVMKEDAKYVFEFLNELDDDMKRLPPEPKADIQPHLSEKERIAMLMKAKNPTGIMH